MSTPQTASEHRLLVPSLMFIALVVAAVGSLGAPLITSVAVTFHVSLDSAQWTLTITLLSGAVATPVLGRLGAGPAAAASFCLPWRSLWRAVSLPSAPCRSPGCSLAGLPRAWAWD